MQPADIAAIRDQAELLYGPDAIHTALDRMADMITAELADSRPVALVNLTGAIIPAG